MRFLHFSDIHLEAGFSEVNRRLFLNKRFMGWANLTLRRRRHFEGALAKVTALGDFARTIGVDVALCTGDHTALGTEPEIRLARDALKPFETLPHGLVTIPGNHDVYLPDAVAVFERHFGELLRSDRPELAVDGRYPLVRLFGDHVAVVAVNSARPNPPMFRSTGLIPQVQLDALRSTLEELRDRFVFVMTHYAPRLANGKPDSARHGLENADAFLRATAALPHGAILHGHVHHCFQVRVPETPIVLSGAGSSTMQGREGLWVYDIEPTSKGPGGVATRGRWNGRGWELDEATRAPL